jgi:hypothetical protein
VRKRDVMAGMSDSMASRRVISSAILKCVSEVCVSWNGWGVYKNGE